MSDSDPFNAKRELDIGGAYFALQALDEAGISTAHLPYSMRVLLEEPFEIVMVSLSVKRM